MWLQFLLENVHFAVNLFLALTLFAVFWLYFDAWRGRKTIREEFRFVGFLFLTISFLVQAAVVESSILTTSLFGNATSVSIVAACRIIGYLVLLSVLVFDPLEKHPEHKKRALGSALLFPVSGGVALAIPGLLFPILGALVAIFYLRRATVGLEDHLKPLSYSFFLLAIADCVGLSSLFISTNNIGVYELVRPFGPFWIIEHILLFAAAIGFGRWVFRYLLKQFDVQLFMILTTSTIVIFLTTTVTFTGLLLKNLQDETMSELTTDVNVLSFTLDSKKAELLSDAQVIAQNTEVIDAVAAANRLKLVPILSDMLLAKKETSLVVMGESGQVLARGEDRDRAGDSLANDPLVKRALLGESAVSVVTHDGVLAPDVLLQAVTPIKKAGVMIGIVLVASRVDNAYIDGLKTATGLDAMVYGDNQISASTLMMPDGKSRLVGLKEEHSAIKSAVLSRGESYGGSIDIINQPYFGAFVALKDVDHNPVGMVFVGKPQVEVLQAAGRSIELTFLLAIALIVITIVPVYFISKYISSQI